MWERKYSISVALCQLAFCANAFCATYYVSPLGNDSNSGGSEEVAFRRVQYAIDQMAAGDTLVVLDGFYTGMLHLKSGITIEAKNPRRVVFSGMVPLQATFTKYTDTIYKAQVDTPIKELIFNEKPMTWARWPDASWSENWDESKKWASAKKGTGPGVLTSDAFSEIADLDLSGAYCFLRYGKGNSCYSRLVESFDGDILHWNDDNFYSRTYTGEDGPRGRAEALLTLEEAHVYHPIHSKFFIAGDIDLLNAPGEWFEERGTLYFYPPVGSDPNKGVVITKANDYCINQEQAVSDVVIDGVDFLGGSVKFSATENKNIRFRNARFTYPGGELLFIDRQKGRVLDKPIEVSGSNITFEKCLFAGSRNSALKLTGSDLVVENCVFIENNRDANFESRALSLRATGAYRISRNTFFNNCSDAISISVERRSYVESVHPEVSYNNIFNAGKYNSDVSGVYMPMGSQEYAEVHHNWMHNINGNAFRLDVAGKELSLHHNVFWESKRGMSVEGYGLFNIYNNTDVLNHVSSDLIRNTLNHAGAKDASQDSTFPLIDDWNVLNNIVEGFTDGIGPREKTLYASEKRKGLVAVERSESDERFGHHERPLEGGVQIRNRGTLQGNLIGDISSLFVSMDPTSLNLMPVNDSVENGVKPSQELRKQHVTALVSSRGAYEVGGDYWVPGSDWMPYGLEVLKSMADSERFAKEYSSLSVIPEIGIADLEIGFLSEALRTRD